MAEVDKNSPEWLFSQIITRLDAMTKEMANFARQFANLHCNTQDRDIEKIGDWIKEHEQKHDKFEKQAQEVSRRHIRLRDGLIIGAVSAAIGALSEWLVLFLTKTQEHLGPTAQHIVHVVKSIFHV